MPGMVCPVVTQTNERKQIFFKGMLWLSMTKIVELENKINKGLIRVALMNKEDREKNTFETDTSNNKE